MQELIRERRRIQNVKSSNVSRLSKAVENYDRGIIPEPIDTSTTYEKLNETLYTNQDLRKKIINLFNNDSQTAEEFFEMFQNSRYTYEDFIKVYSQLLSQFKGFLAHPVVVFDVMEKLIKNINTTGVATASSYEQMREAQDIIEQQVSESLLGRKAGADLYDKVEALTALLQNDETFDADELVQSQSYQNAKDLLKEAQLNIIRVLGTDQSEDEKLNDLIDILGNIKKTTFDVVRKEQERNTAKLYREEDKGQTKAKIKELKKSVETVIKEKKKQLEEVKRDAETIMMLINNKQEEVDEAKKRNARGDNIKIKNGEKKLLQYRDDFDTQAELIAQLEADIEELKSSKAV